jgi:predicted RNA-binding Zn-ribbon protein involved in translation (DUF1610 family)
MPSRLLSLFAAAARFFLRDQTPYCASCGRRMTPTQIEPLLTTRVDVVTFTCKKCGAGEKRARRRPGKHPVRR